MTKILYIYIYTTRNKLVCQGRIPWEMDVCQGLNPWKNAHSKSVCQGFHPWQKNEGLALAKSLAKSLSKSLS
ncbi:hypothetical protein GYH30_016488 [Glycine max]|nr:hypothetical protein GYH30_016488 [Glycine max]